MGPEEWAFTERKYNGKWEEGRRQRQNCKMRVEEEQEASRTMKKRASCGRPEEIEAGVSGRAIGTDREGGGSGGEQRGEGDVMAEELGETGAVEDGVGTSKQVKMGEHGGRTRVSRSARGCAIRVGPNNNRSV